MLEAQLATVSTLWDEETVQTIGIFDSGVGGLTVAMAMRRHLPGEMLLYLGDTARLPYGTKSPETVVRYALNAAAFLMERGIKMLVVACNTASAQALPALIRAYPHLPVLGVVEPGAAAACRRSTRGGIIVAATEGTCRSGAYERAIRAIRPEARVTTVPCPMFVALAEEGMTGGPIVEAMARRYLAPLFAEGDNDCLVLGCTHFPLLAPTLTEVVGEAVAVVDCAEATAAEAAHQLAVRGIAAPPGPGGLTLLATDAPARFTRIAEGLFPRLAPLPEVEVVDL
jgi:glutamate racemase